MSSYYDLVVSKTPTIYIPFSSGSNADVMGATLADDATSDLNPTYDYTFKKQGVRSKKIGHNGAGTYDYKRYAKSGTGGNTRIYYFHLECWLYQPSATFTDLTWLSQINSKPTSTYVYPNYVRLSTARNLQFVTQEPVSGTQDHTLTSTVAISTDQWVHLAVQYDMGIKRIYINGVLDSEVDTGFTGGIPSYITDPNYTGQTVFVDEFAVWNTESTTKPANFPTVADILERINFPQTKTKWWDATTEQWLSSGDEKYWNGSEWISLQDKTYKYWNGSEWVIL